MDGDYESGGWINTLSQAMQAKVLAATTPRNYSDGELIYAMGDHCDVSYMIEEGMVKLCVVTPDGKEHLSALLDHYHCFGIQGAIDGSPCANSAYAVGAVRLRSLSNASLSQLRKDHHEIAEALLRFINYRFRTALSYIHILMFFPLQQQLVFRLLLIARASGKASANGVEIQANLTQDDLAKFTGASRQSINKELKVLQALNLIESKNKRITILDMAGLEAVNASL